MKKQDTAQHEEKTYDLPDAKELVTLAAQLVGRGREDADSIKTTMENAIAWHKAAQDALEEANKPKDEEKPADDKEKSGKKEGQAWS